MDSTAPNLCSQCQKVDLADILEGDAYTVTSIALDTFRNIIKNDHCELCKLMVRALRGKPLGNWDPTTSLDKGLRLGRDSKQTWRSILVFFEDSPKHPQGRLIAVEAAALEHSENRKPFDLIVEEQIDSDRVKRWLFECEHHHPGCVAPERILGLSSGEEDLPLLLLDVKEMKLARCGWDTRYLTLSYVWGNAKQYQTNRANFNDLLKAGALLRVRSKLPNCIRDAIDFVASIGESYLWIDTLCIVQDDAETKDRYISSMGAIYGNSQMTLVNLDGKDANSPLPGVTAGTRLRSEPPVKIGSMMVLPEPVSILGAVRHSTWDTRGWTYQEDVLSKRCLYFGKTQLHWQCGWSASEIDVAKLTEIWYSLRSKMPWRDSMPVCRPNGHINSWTDSGARLAQYDNLVISYTNRKLTIPSDSLRAFAGVLSALAISFKWTFVSALPEQLFDRLLLWRSRRANSRLRDAETISSKTKTHPQEYGRSPTWCWTAWTGAVDCTGRFFPGAGYSDELVYNGVTIRPEVDQFFVKDKSGCRELIRDSGLEKDSASALSQNLKSGPPAKLLENSPINTLLFEARTLPLATYTFSWAGLDPMVQPMDESGLSPRYRSAHVTIFNRSGLHCGSIVSWLPEPNLISSYQLVLLSRTEHDRDISAADFAKQAYESRHFRGSDDKGYALFFDPRVFKYRRGCCLNIMVVRFRENGFAERVAIGQMHADAWEADEELTKAIILV